MRLIESHERSRRKQICQAFLQRRLRSYHIPDGRLTLMILRNIRRLLRTLSTNSSQQVKVWGRLITHFALSILRVVRLILPTWARSRFLRLFDLKLVVWNRLAIKHQSLWTKISVLFGWRLLTFIDYIVQPIPSCAVFTFSCIQIEVIISCTT